MKILVLNGSPKKKSDTFRLTEAFLKGLNRDGQHEVNIINVIEKKISPCMGCFGCWQRGDGHCVIVIWSFPLYCYAMPSHLKAVVDRTIPLVKMDMVQEDDGTVHHEALADFSKMHTLVICGCGFPDWDGNFDALRMMCKICFNNPDMVCVPETPMLNIPEARNSPLQLILLKIIAVRKILAQNGFLDGKLWHNRAGVALQFVRKKDLQKPPCVELVPGSRRYRADAIDKRSLSVVYIRRNQHHGCFRI